MLQDGVQWFLGVHKQQLAEDRKGEPRLGSYQRAVRALLKKQVVRVVVAMTALVKKIHIYEVMNRLAEHLDRLVYTVKL